MDYVTGKQVKIQGNTIKTNIPGRVIRVLYVRI